MDRIKSTVTIGTITLSCLFMMQAFVPAAGAVEYTGWDVDFIVGPHVIAAGDTIDIKVHVYYFGNTSARVPFTADAPGVTVTITSAFFNSIGITESNGWLNYTDHPDEPGNYTFTVSAIFDAETKTKTRVLTVYPAGTVLPTATATAAPTSPPVPTSPATPTPTPTSALAATPVATGAPPATATPAATVVAGVSATPAPSSPAVVAITALVVTAAILSIVGRARMK